MKRCMESEGLMGTFQQITVLMHRRAHRQMKHGREDAMHPGQGRLLALLQEKQPISQRDITDLLDIRPSSVSEALKKLEAKGYISREQDEGDKRNVIWTVTEQGKEKANAACEGRQKMLSGLFDALDESEQEQLDCLLKKLVESWKEDDDKNCCKENKGNRHHKMMQGSQGARREECYEAQKRAGRGHGNGCCNQ